MVRRLKSSAASLDKLHPPEQFVWRNRRIVLNDAVATSNQIPRARSRGLLRDAVSNEPAAARVKNDLPYGNSLKVYAPNEEEVTGLDRGSHACTGDAQARASKCARCPGKRSQVRVFKSSTSRLMNQKVGLRRLPVVSAGCLACADLAARKSHRFENTLEGTGRLHIGLFGVSLRRLQILRFRRT